MRILYLAALYLPHVGGIEVLLHDLTAELERRGHATTLVSSALTTDESGAVQFDGLTVLRLRVHDALEARDPRALLEVRRAIDDFVSSFEPDIVHSHDVGGVVWLYRQTRLAKRLPLMMTMHNVVPNFIQGSRGSLAAQLAAGDRVTTVSKSVADSILELEPSLAERLTVIPNGVTPPDEPVTPVPTHPPRLVCLGRLVDQKRVDLAIEAVARLVATHPDVRLTIAGTGAAEQKLRQLAIEREVSDRVDFLGLVGRDRVMSLLRDATIVVSASDYEGMPLVALEAAWMGRPMVATRAAGLRDVVIDGETGALVDIGDLDALTATLDSLLRDPGRVQGLGAGARIRAEQEFSLATCADRYEALYAEMLAQAPASDRL